ncbi:MAG: hypothetical protein LBJ64_04935, partial [Deltaproteobacteria bacterium]|nr:hypothetical protein [Deltaproteobacteria bacterium]
DQAIEADFFDRPSFVSQAASVNRRLWASVTGGSDGGREVLHLELEAVVGDCLAADLEREDSSIRRTLLEEDVRRRVLCALAGRRGCWSPQLLGESLSSAALKDSSQALGTAFFWEIGESGRRHPMRIESGGGEAVLAGPGLRLSLRPDAVRSALRSGRIGPSLFLDYLTLADHNLETRAGVFALSYLPGLLEPMADILERPDLRAYARRSAWLAAGALPVRAVNREVEPLWQSEAAAGALELFAGEPWTMDRWRRLAELRLKDVWPFTASEWYLEETRPERRIRRWAAVLENMRSLGKGLTLPG